MVDKIIHAIANLTEKLEEFKIGAAILLLMATLGVVGVVIYNTEFRLSAPDNTNTVALPSTLASDLDEYLSHLQDETHANIVAVGLYLTDDKYEELYITFIRQRTSPGIYPIPNTKYFLSTNNLYKRYLIHKKGECFTRSFEQTNSKMAVSCPLFNSKRELSGYLTVEYVVDNPPKSSKELEIQVLGYTPKVEKILSKWKAL